MAPRPYDDEELSISLSPSQIRRNNHNSNPHAGNHRSMDAAMHSSIPAPLPDKVRTEQRIGQYNILRTLGEGSFGKVKLAVHRSTNQQVALKIIARKKLISRDMAGRVEREIEYLQLLRHPHIIKLYTVIKTPAEIIMVLEYAGGELFDYIVQHGRMKEAEARRFFQQMLCAVEYCHRHKIVHRDLKPENLLLDENLNVKIADFGLSNIMTDGNFLKTSCGSPNYAAPEVIGGKLYAGPEVDVWSCGVILYVLLVGRLPFDDEHIPSLFAKIARGTYVVPTWMSPGAAGLIKKMLVVNPVQRATISEIRQDPWFLTDLPDYLQLPVEPFFNTGIDPDKSIKMSDIAPNASPKVQEKLHNEVTEKISKTMGYGRRDVQEALEAEEPSAIKDAYMIVRENKMMQGNHEDYDKYHGSGDGDNNDDDDYDGAPLQREKRLDSFSKYKLPADPWHIQVRWTTDKLRKGSQIHSADELVPDKLHVKTDENDVFQVVAMRMDIQIYEMEQGVYLVDFKCDGYETSGGQVLEEKDVTSPFPFLDMAARLIMQLADAD
ncbi:putative protein kinase snf1 protein [Phaeoacremonium minimum UCRPA7]|uniref:non-specific serine/threonine protein kinase n=1 Tax=Phaeoacremonium minimum (strain UCR-PA7) TaxID=1286976 RepID=R8BTN1_PHAM7|nr:putative protein kinase snf1 protein [Phaeoacremonium minimum UCRPA7]EOO02721.1 putative protein kinase snf1 protein [Phaeoacremonium minimum UCRPA7]